MLLLVCADFCWLQSTSCMSNMIFFTFHILKCPNYFQYEPITNNSVDTNGVGWIVNPCRLFYVKLKMRWFCGMASLSLELKISSVWRKKISVEKGNCEVELNCSNVFCWLLEKPLYNINKQVVVTHSFEGVCGICDQNNVQTISEWWLWKWEASSRSNKIRKYVDLWRFELEFDIFQRFIYTVSLTL